MSRSFKIICSILGVLGLLGCGALYWLGWGHGNPDEWASTSLAGPSNDAVRVVMSWDEPADVDLEIWDSEGKRFITSASELGYGYIDGMDGSECVDFRRYPTCDLSAGTYVVSVCFVEGAEVASSTRVTLSVTKPDGGVEERTHELMWEEGKDQWHAFSIDAASGEIEDIDEVVDNRLRSAGRSATGRSGAGG